MLTSCVASSESQSGLNYLFNKISEAFNTNPRSTTEFPPAVQPLPYEEQLKKLQRKSSPTTLQIFTRPLLASATHHFPTASAPAQRNIFDSLRRNGYYYLQPQRENGHTFTSEDNSFGTNSLQPPNRNPQQFYNNRKATSPEQFSRNVQFLPSIRYTIDKNGQLANFGQPTEQIQQPQSQFQQAQGQSQKQLQQQEQNEFQQRNRAEEVPTKQKNNNKKGVNNNNNVVGGRGGERSEGQLQEEMQQPAVSAIKSKKNKGKKNGNVDEEQIEDRNVEQVPVKSKKNGRGKEKAEQQEDQDEEPPAKFKKKKINANVEEQNEAPRRKKKGKNNAEEMQDQEETEALNDDYPDDDDQPKKKHHHHHRHTPKESEVFGDALGEEESPSSVALNVLNAPRPRSRYKKNQYQRNEDQEEGESPSSATSNVPKQPLQKNKYKKNQYHTDEEEHAPSSLYYDIMKTPLKTNGKVSPKKYRSSSRYRLVPSTKAPPDHNSFKRYIPDSEEEEETSRLSEESEEFAPKLKQQSKKIPNRRPNKFGDASEEDSAPRRSRKISSETEESSESSADDSTEETHHEDSFFDFRPSFSRDLSSQDSAERRRDEDSSELYYQDPLWNRKGDKYEHYGSPKSFWKASLPKRNNFEREGDFSTEDPRERYREKSKAFWKKFPQKEDFGYKYIENSESTPQLEKAPGNHRMSRYEEYSLPDEDTGSVDAPSQLSSSQALPAFNNTLISSSLHHQFKRNGQVQPWPMPFDHEVKSSQNAPQTVDSLDHKGEFSQNRPQMVESFNRAVESSQKLPEKVISSDHEDQSSDDRNQKMKYFEAEAQSSKVPNQKAKSLNHEVGSLQKQTQKVNSSDLEGQSPSNYYQKGKTFDHKADSQQYHTRKVRSFNGKAESSHDNLQQDYHVGQSSNSQPRKVKHFDHNHKGESIQNSASGFQTNCCPTSENNYFDFYTVPEPKPVDYSNLEKLYSTEDEVPEESENLKVVTNEETFSVKKNQNYK